jgi:hypothetical protein
LVTGGKDEDNSLSSSAEYLSENGWKTFLPELPFEVSLHCMVKINLTTLAIIGGNLGNTQVHSIYIYQTKFSMFTNYYLDIVY